ncbi:MAG: hypothetical protein B7Z15_02845 [Rhizobiales bacterium 32-66-8]|nr:MAG: hypothetical protein B7Z15_02845 [Rhizobiales bacterium 32-66-8]
MDRSVATFRGPGSGPFAALFRDGMALLGRVSSYLSGPGRADVALLEREAQLAYHAETRALTTLLLQIAAWLLMERAVAEGEMTLDMVQLQVGRTDLRAQPPVPSDFHPATLRALRGEAEALRRAVIDRAETMLAAAEANEKKPRPFPHGRPQLRLVRDED